MTVCKINRVICLSLMLLTVVHCDVINNEVGECNLPQNVKDEIASYAPIADRIIDETIYGKFKGGTYKHLADFIDEFGNRIAGSKNLENAIDYMVKKSHDFNLENVHTEDVQVPHWVRGQESATLIKPRHQSLKMLGLGSSIGTPPQGICAEALVVKSFDELQNVSSKAQGKIVVFDEKFISYGESVKYRGYGASFAARYNAVATLISSVTPFSINTPHTGWQAYLNNTKQIPTACITVEDAHMLQRMQDRGETIVIKLKMEAQNLPAATSRNTIGEIVGKSNPEKVVVISGHLDSWDVGEGAMDDGGGAFLSWSSLVLLKALDLKPRRTIRSILWTAEEEGLVGAFAYVKAHKNETQNLNFVMESDAGTFTPDGLKYTGLPEGGCILQEILKLLTRINATRLEHPADGAPDLTLWLQEGIPGASLLNEAQHYFWYHHSAGDTMDVEDPDALDKATALWATVAYVVADLSSDMPKNFTKIDIEEVVAHYVPIPMPFR